MDQMDFRIILHNKLCEVADLFMRQYNPCQWWENKCIKGTPDCCRNINYEQLKDANNCLFLGRNGCSIETLGCKLWFCNEVFDAMPRELKLALKSLEIIARVHRLSSFPEEHFREAKDGYQISDTLRYFDEEKE